MERSQLIIVLAVVVAAIGLFGMRFARDSDDERVVAGSRGGLFQRSDEQSGFAGGKRGGFAGEGGAPIGGRSGVSGGRGDRAGGGWSSRGGSAPAVRGGTSGLSGGVASGSTRGGFRPDRLVSIADSGRVKGTGKVDSGSDARSELIETLASLPSAQRESRERGQPDDGTVFSLPLEGTTVAEDGTEPLNPDIQGIEPGPDGTRFVDGSFLAYPNNGQITERGATISFEFDPEWDASDPNANFFFKMGSTWENRIEILKDGRYFRFIVFTNEGRETGIGVPMDAWTPGAHTVDATFDTETGEMILHIDGAEMGRTKLEGTFVPPPQYNVGGEPGRAANAVLRNVQIRALSHGTKSS